MSKDMKQETRKRTDHRGGLNVSQAIEPIKKVLNRLAHRTDKRGKRVTRNQDIAF